MQHNAAFHLGLHCLPKKTFLGFPVYEGLIAESKFSIFQLVPVAEQTGLTY